jgi:hypothetical protein
MAKKKAKKRTKKKPVKPQKRVKTRKKSPARSAKKRASTPKKKAAPKKSSTPKVVPPPVPNTTELAARFWEPSAEAEEIGDLEIASGKVKVSDAGTLFAPVEVAIPKGTWKVRINRNADGENLSAILYRSDAAPVAWTERGAYAVDAGMSGFFDSDVFGRVDKHVWPISIYDDLISKHLDPQEAKGHAGAFVPFEDVKFSACRSGWGDGVYPVYAGADASGTIVMVVTTFLD